MPHALAMRSTMLSVGLELAESRTVLDSASKQIDEAAGVSSSWRSCPPSPCLDVALTPFLGEPCQTGFEWSTSEVMVDECGIDAEGLAHPDRCEVPFSRE